jgi:hypothetical protein
MILSKHRQDGLTCFAQINSLQSLHADSAHVTC